MKTAIFILIGVFALIFFLVVVAQAFLWAIRLFLFVFICAAIIAVGAAIVHFIKKLINKL